MNHRTTRRGIRLATTLAAASLAVTAAPQAVAADANGDGAMKLTSDQVTELAERVQVDVHAEEVASRPAERDDAAALAEAEADGTVDGTTDGSAEGGTEGGASTQAEGDPVTFTEESTLEGVQGMGVTADAGSGGDYFTLHSFGNVQRHAADGETTWTRTTRSLYAEWGVRSWRAWERELYRPQLVFGYNAVSPFTPNSDQGYATGDLSGDGQDDLVFSTAVGTSPAGWSSKVGTYVTVLDGRTGDTLWSKLYSFAAQLTVVDETLLIADSPALNQRGSGGPATLTGLTFEESDGGLAPASTWTYDVGTTQSATWAAIEDLGGGEIAAVWDLRKTSTTPARSTTLVLDVTDGSVRWQTDSDLYGRQLHRDAARGRLVALEQADPTDGVRYQIASYDLRTGARTVHDTRVNALPTAMTVGDLSNGGGDEYVVSESTLTPYLYVNAATVRVLDGETPSVALWSHTTKRAADNTQDGPSNWALSVVDGSLVVSAQNDTDIDLAANLGGLQYGKLTVLSGSGKVRWQKDGATASPMAHEVVSSGQKLRTIDLQQNVRTYNLGNGKQADLTPLRGDLAFAKAVEVDGDGLPDVVAGGASRGVWAWSGTSLKNGEPKQLWQTTVPGQVHGIETGDVDGDGDAEIVVAADTATVVIDAATGKIVATIDGGGQYIRSVTVDDVDADGAEEILVPTDALRVYRGNGSAVWTYSAPAGTGDVVFSNTVVADGRVHTQYSSVGALDRQDSVQNGVALDGKQGAVLWAANPVAPEIAEGGRLYGAVLDDGVFASPSIPYADGHAVVHTWMIRSGIQGVPNSPISARIVVEIRDGRTGELLHQRVGGSPFSHDNFFTDDEAGILYQLSFGTFTGYLGGGEESYASVAGSLRGAEMISGPGGRPLVGGGTEAGVAVYDRSLLSSGKVFANGDGGALLYGGQNYLAADLDGDGVDEMLSLNYDDFGEYRTSELIGGGAFALDNGIHQMTTYSLS